jgi:hypothetical protein
MRSDIFLIETGGSFRFFPLDLFTVQVEDEVCCLDLFDAASRNQSGPSSELSQFGRTDAYVAMDIPTSQSEEYAIEQKAENL